MSETLASTALGPVFARLNPPPRKRNSRQVRRGAYGPSHVGRLDRRCTALLVAFCCGLIFALSGCGGRIVVASSTAAAGTLVVSPNPVTFGTVSVGQTATTTVSLVNSDSAPVSVTQLDLSGEPFSVSSQTKVPFTIPVGQAYELNVKFNPATAGTATGLITVASNASTGSKAVINLNGTAVDGTAAPAALSALSCISSSMTGSGTDACTVTLTAAAPSGGLSVNLSSSSSAVTIPSTVTVPANATSAGFTATVSSVVTAQVVTMTASACSVFTSFTLQLNAAILALSINANSVPFGDVVVNTSATQSVTLTSTGTVPVTISGATLTGAGFTLPGAEFPATLNPNQETTLNIEFDPTAAGAATGQVAITSNSSTNANAIIGLSGTGVAPVVVAVTPASLSANAGTIQQLAATVTGTSNTGVTWAVSGSGCSGSGCGTISSSGLYTAPMSIPSPPSVTITATSVEDATKSASVAVTLLPASHTTYYLATAANGGNDSNNGLSPNAPWRTPNHSVNCGDVILAAPGNYPGLMPFGTVTCPAGNNVAWLWCATFDTCKIVTNSGLPNAQGILVTGSYWGVQGWEVTAVSGGTGACFVARPPGATPIHHIVFANNIANGCSDGGFLANSNAGYKVGVDYFAVVGNIAYNAAQTSVVCTSGIDVWQPMALDSLPGTHYYFAGNFSYDNVEPNPCNGGLPTDGEGLFFDTPQPYSQQMVMDNNISIFNGGAGIQAIKNSTGSPNAPIYLRHNTTFGNQTGNINAVQACAEIYIYNSHSTEVFGNLSVTSESKACRGVVPVYVLSTTGADSTDLIHSNYGYSAAGYDTYGSGDGFSFGTDNVLDNPHFANPVDPGPPNCGNSTSVPNCMAKVIANFTPSVTAARSYGYQIPGSTQVYDPLFPKWLCNTSLPSGLMTMGCLTTQ